MHVHVTIRPENFYLPQCVDTYEDIKVYDYATQHPFHRVEALSLNKNSHLRYSLTDNEKIFAIDERTGYLTLLPAVQNPRRLKSDYLLTVQAMDAQYKLAVNCYVSIQLIRRRQLVPRFLSAPRYDVNLLEIEQGSGRLRQRLLQVAAILDTKVYDKKLEIRYRIVDSNQHFIINRQTGYIATKQPLRAFTTYEFTVSKELEALVSL